MKKNIFIALATGLMTVLAGCVVVVTALTSNYQYQSSYIRSDTLQPVICDNRTTQIAYSFKYRSLSEISSWTETYIGLVSGTVQGPFTRTQANANISGGRIEVVLQFNPQTAPLSLTPGKVSAQAITPVPVPPPPSNTGQTRLEIRINGESIPSSTKVFDVFANCP